MLSCASIFSQEALKSTEEEYYDFLSLQGLAERPTLGYRTLSDSEWALTEEAKTADENVWKNNSLGSKWTVYEPAQKTDNFFTRGIDQSVKVKIYGPEWYNSYNTAAPYGQNDGALWQGKGYNTSLTAGARLEAYGLEVTFKPQLSFSQNREFDLMDNSEYYTNKFAYIWGYKNDKGIDAPQRFGDKAFWTYDWGDTEIRYTWHNFTTGAGFQNPWLGPAWVNPMLGSNNASSYPKIDAGLRRTKTYIPFCNWYIGDIEGRIWTGLLTESDYFDTNPSNDKRMLNAISASYMPSFIPNFSIGINRIFITDWSTHNIKYIPRLFTLSRSNGSQTGTKEDEDQKLSLFIDWQFPKVGFEFYGELGIDDFTSQKRANPFHTAIYTIGAKQSFPLVLSKIHQKFQDLKSEIIFEWNNFEMSQDFQMQWRYMGYYAHSSISQGYTQKGQLLGSGSGYFGNSQFLGYKIYFSKGYIMPFFHRHCPDNNFIYNIPVGNAIDSGSDEYKKYYGKFHTCIAIGGEANYFITNNLNLSALFSIIPTDFPMYDNDGINDSMNYNGRLTLKYNF